MAAPAAPLYISLTNSGFTNALTSDVKSITLTFKDGTTTTSITGSRIVITDEIKSAKVTANAGTSTPYTVTGAFVFPEGLEATIKYGNTATTLLVQGPNGVGGTLEVPSGGK